MKRKVKIIVGLLVVLVIVIAAGLMTSKWWAGADVDLTKQQESQKEFLKKERNKPFQYVPGEIIIKIKDSISESPSNISSLSVLNVKYQAKIEPIKNNDSAEEKTNAIESKGLYKLSVNEKEAKIPLAEYQKDPNIEFAEPNYIYYTSTNIIDRLQSRENANDPLFRSKNSWGQEIRDQWNLEKMNMGETWTLSKGDGATVAVIDSGIDPNHEDLKDKIVESRDFVDVNLNDYYGCSAVPGEDYTEPDNELTDFAGHGTHVAGIVAATTNNNTGVASIGWNTKIMPVRAGFVLQCGQYKYGLLESDDIYKALLYSTRKNAKIINMSFGGSYSQLIDKGIKFAYGKGALLIAAAGNSADPVNEDFFPANSPYILTVGASNAEDKIAFYSNYGAKIDVFAPGGEPDIIIGGESPVIGKGILSTASSQADYGNAHKVGNYVSLSGTSMASPHVAGLASLILSKNTNLTNEQAREIIRKGAVDINKTELPGWDAQVGFGRIRSLQSLKLTGDSPIAVFNIVSKVKEKEYAGKEKITIKGLASGNNFDHYTIEYQKKEYGDLKPNDKWQTEGVVLMDDGKKSSDNMNQTLAEINSDNIIQGSSYFIKLTVYNKNGDKSQDYSIINYLGAKKTIDFPVKYKGYNCKDMVNPGIGNNRDYIITKDESGENKILLADVKSWGCNDKYRYLYLYKYPMNKKTKESDFEKFGLQILDDNGNFPYLRSIASADIDGDKIQEVVLAINFQDELTGSKPSNNAKIYAFDIKELKLKDGYPIELKSKEGSSYTVQEIILANMGQETNKSVIALGHAFTSADLTSAKSSVITISPTKTQSEYLISEFNSISPTYFTPYASGPYEHETSDISVADINGDNQNEILVFSSYVDCYHECENITKIATIYGNNKTANKDLVELLKIEENDINKSPKNLVTADINNDQKSEIAVSTGRKIAILNNDFQLLDKNFWPQKIGAENIQFANLEFNKPINLIASTRDRIEPLDLQIDQIFKEIPLGSISLPPVFADINNDENEEIIVEHQKWTYGYELLSEIPRMLAFNPSGEKIADRKLADDNWWGIWDNKMQVIAEPDKKILTFLPFFRRTVIFEEDGYKSSWPMGRHDNCNSNNYNYKCE